MLERLGIDAIDRRNLRIVVVVMSIVMLVFVDAPILPRIVAAIIFGLISGLFFLIVTAFVHRVR
jgi:hypothetical protein